MAGYANWSIPTKFNLNYTIFTLGKISFFFLALVQYVLPASKNRSTRFFLDAYLLASSHAVSNRLQSQANLHSLLRLLLRPNIFFITKGAAHGRSQSHFKMYKLRAELRMHTADVRDVAVSPTGMIATASRDKTVAIWKAESKEPIHHLIGHTHYVNHVAFVDATTLVTASSDKTLRVWNVDTAECIRVLDGHTSNVCSVALLCSEDSSSCTIVSASWDHTARVWDVHSGRCLHVLSGHSAAVWNASGLSDGRVVTVAADKQVRIWTLQNQSPDSTTVPPVHTDVVRAVTRAPSGGFTTVGNDSRIVVWRLADGTFSKAAQQCDAHDGSYIYSVDARETGAGKQLIVTGGEDNALRLTELHMASDAQLASGQTIMHPGTVWSVCMGQGDDIVTGCSDGVARIFTRDADQFASEADLLAFEKLVSGRQVSSKVIGGVDVSKLPDATTALNTPGKKDGENKIVRTGTGKAEVHMWSASEERWTKIGDVVDGPDGGASLGSGTVKGKSYDFVFDVEIGEGGKKEPLGYNRGENPYLAADRFIEDNDLGTEFSDQIAKFIEQQIPADALQEATGGAVSDPLTGGSRYVPGSGGSSSGGGGVPSGGDPLTGGSRYIPNGGGMPPPGVLPPPRKLIPHRDGMVSYKSSDQLDKIQQKLSELNAELQKSGSDKALTMDEASVFGQSLFPKLKTRGGAVVVLEDADCAVVEKLLKWPTRDVFAALDIGRLVVSTASGGAYLFGKSDGSVLDNVLEHMGSAEANGAVHIMGCRFVCNLFGNRVVGDVVRREIGRVLQGVSAAGRSGNRRARETHASVLINFAVLVQESGESVDMRGMVIEHAVTAVGHAAGDEEVMYRLLVAMGTAMCGDVGAAKRGVELGVASAASDCAKVSARLQQVALEIATLIAI